MPTYFINWKYATDGHYEEGNKSYKSVNAARKAIMNEIENRWDVFSGTVAKQTETVGIYLDRRKIVKTETIGVVKFQGRSRDKSSFTYRDYMTKKTYWLNKDGSLNRRV